MIIGGYQPLTLIDFPDKLASIVFTKGCMFRCPYCHNPELVEPSDWYGEDEKKYFEFLKKRKHMLDGVVVTGGEPTIHKDLPKLIRTIKDIGYAVKLDTNGMNPEMVKALIREKLIDYVAMDIKHTWGKYQSVANIVDEKFKQLEHCEETAEFIRGSGIQYEWRTTVYPHLHKREDLEEIVAWMTPGEKYFLQQMNYSKTLRDGLVDSPLFNIEEETQRLQKKFPEVIVKLR